MSKRVRGQTHLNTGVSWADELDLTVRTYKEMGVVKVEADCPHCISQENLGCGSCGGGLGNVVHCFSKAG